MTEQENKKLLQDIEAIIDRKLCNPKTTCPIGLTETDALKWQGMLKVAGIVGVAAAWTVVAAIATGFVAALWAGFRHFINLGVVTQ